MAVPAGYALSLFALVLLSLFLLTPSLQQQQQQQHYASFPRPPPPPPPPRATPSTSTAPSGRAGQRLDESVATAEAVRKDLLRLLDASWQRVRRLVEAETLCRCEEALRGATILLVLATLRRSADLFPSSRAALEAMLRSADVNHDGQLSYAEWANWLTSTKEGAPEAGGGGGTVAGGGGGEGLEGFFSPSASSDPMVSSLAQVLGHALCALKVVARLSSDAPTLAAAFVAGGMMSEALDEEVRLSLLSRLAPQTRDLVLLSLSLEASSPVFRQSVVVVDSMSEGPSQGEVVVIREQQEEEEEEEGLVMASRSSSDSEAVRLLLQRLLRVADETVAMQRSLRDLDDKHSLAWREATIDRLQSLRGDGRLVLTLGLALRIARLQNLHLPCYHHHRRGDSGGLTPYSRAEKQQLAMESLQLWAPLAYQVEAAAATAELEAHAYMLLFPSSFSSFLSWYSALRPLALRALASLRADSEALLAGDALLRRCCQRAVLQTRLKTPASAFTKMVKGAKLRDDLFDILDLLGLLSDWREDRSRFKDYVTQPKASGYQSVHLVLAHRPTALRVEVQLRTERMHRLAEHGSAAHSRYKALLLPSSKTIHPFQ
eukprot:gene8450-9316_t